MNRRTIANGNKRPVHEWLRAMHRLQPYRTPRAMWLALASAIIMSGVMVVGAIEPITHHLQPDFHVGFIAVDNLVVFASLYAYNFWILRCGLKEYKLLSAGFLGSMAIALALALVCHWAEALAYGMMHTSNTFIMQFIVNSAAALIAYLIALLLNNVTHQQQLVVENEHLQTENLTARYETLERQVGPHFLFNSLNTLDGLIGTDDAGAHTYLHRLADIFRYSMQNQKVVTLADELEFSHSYVYLMQLRHGDGLVVDEHIDPSKLDCLVPHISLQLLLENAIKHNVATTRRPLVITVATTPEGMLRVSNPKRPKTDKEESHGIGLVNLAHRYSLLFNREINISDQEDTFCVELPLI